jgi:NADH-quinone oxidoreductase subunit N
MTAADLVCLLPLIVTAGTAVVVMLATAFIRSHTVTVVLTVLGLAAAMATLAAAGAGGPRQVTTLLMMDRYALFYTGLVLAASIAAVLLSAGYARTRADRQGEYFVLLVLVALGAIVLVWSDHLVPFLLGLEIVSVSLFPLIAFRRRQAACLEAAVKYFVPAGVSSAFLVFGMALVYAARGTMQFSHLAAMHRHAAGGGAGGADLLLLAGVGMIVVGFAFKLALVPFHMWAPDVYQGATAPVAAVIATISKGAVFALLLRYFAQLSPRGGAGTVFWLLWGLALASMTVGNLLALLQHSVKRILACSSIAHMGYLLVALLAGGAAVAFYLVAYFIATLGAFGVIAALSDSRRDADDLADFRGLAWRRPGLALTLTAMVLSLAGLPLTAGFLGKFYVLLAGVHSGLWALAVALVLNSALGLFYYLRIVAEIFRPGDELTATDASAPASSPAAWPTAATLCVLTLLIVWLGLWPQPMMALLQSLAPAP